MDQGELEQSARVGDINVALIWSEELNRRVPIGTKWTQRGRREEIPINVTSVMWGSWKPAPHSDQGAWLPDSFASSKRQTNRIQNLTLPIGGDLPDDDTASSPAGLPIGLTVNAF